MNPTTPAPASCEDSSDDEIAEPPRTDSDANPERQSELDKLSSNRGDHNLKNHRDSRKRVDTEHRGEGGSYPVLVCKYCPFRRFSRMKDLERHERVAHSFRTQRRQLVNEVKDKVKNTRKGKKEPAHEQPVVDEVRFPNLRDIGTGGMLPQWIAEEPKSSPWVATPDPIESKEQISDTNQSSPPKTERPRQPAETYLYQSARRSTSRPKSATAAYISTWPDSRQVSLPASLITAYTLRIESLPSGFSGEDLWALFSATKGFRELWQAEEGTYSHYSAEFDDKNHADRALKELETYDLANSQEDESLKIVPFEILRGDLCRPVVRTKQPVGFDATNARALLRTLYRRSQIYDQVTRAIEGKQSGNAVDDNDLEPPSIQIERERKPYTAKEGAGKIYGQEDGRAPPVSNRAEAPSMSTRSSRPGSNTHVQPPYSSIGQSEPVPIPQREAPLTSQSSDPALEKSSSILTTTVSPTPEFQTCDRCQRRRTKCNGLHPCSSCSRVGVDCIYSTTLETTVASDVEREGDFDASPPTNPPEDTLTSSTRAPRKVACLRCHKNKIKCDHQQPCKACGIAKAECVYGTQDQVLLLSQKHFRRRKGNGDTAEADSTKFQIEQAAEKQQNRNKLFNSQRPASRWKFVGSEDYVRRLKSAAHPADPKMTSLDINEEDDSVVLTKLFGESLWGDSPPPWRNIGLSPSHRELSSSPSADTVLPDGKRPEARMGLREADSDATNALQLEGLSPHTNKSDPPSKTHQSLDPGQMRSVTFSSDQPIVDAGTERRRSTSAMDMTAITINQVVARQQKAMLVFTLTTVIFLPLSFVASLYGMNLEVLSQNNRKLGPVVDDRPNYIASTLVCAVIIIGLAITVARIKARKAEAMFVFTTITVIFLPLSFTVSLFGMNFEAIRKEPNAGSSSGGIVNYVLGTTITVVLFYGLVAVGLRSVRRYRLDIHPRFSSNIINDVSKVYDVPADRSKNVDKRKPNSSTTATLSTNEPGDSDSSDSLRRSSISTELEELNYIFPPNRASGGLVNVNQSLQCIADFVLQRVRPERRAGLTRLEWTCSCGKLMYGDYNMQHSTASGFVRALPDFQTGVEKRRFGLNVVNRIPLLIALSTYLVVAVLDSAIVTVARKRDESFRSIVANLVLLAPIAYIGKSALTATIFARSFTDGLADEENATLDVFIRQLRQFWVSLTVLLLYGIVIPNVSGFRPPSFYVLVATNIAVFGGFTAASGSSIPLSMLNGAGTGSTQPASKNDGSSTISGQSSATTGSNSNVSGNSNNNQNTNAGSSPQHPMNVVNGQAQQTQTISTTSLAMYFELCVNRGSQQISLCEIQMTDVQGRKMITTDMELFKQIRKRYDNHRRCSLRRLLYRPQDIHFVQFGVLRAGVQTGIYDQPLAIPPTVEVTEKRYHYFECPLNPLPPIDRRTFFHYFWEHEKHPPSGNNPVFESLFMSRLPKKLGDSIFMQREPKLQLGWGVHIIEGPNKPLLAWLASAIMVISFVVSLAYDIGIKNQDSGFAIGQWMVGVLGTMLMALYFQLADAA